jgi:mRNA interferase YafQ
MNGPADKRARLPRTFELPKPFRKDWDRLARTGRYDMRRLKQAMMLLVANDGPLGPEWLDHPLKGNLLGWRECHIGGDFLLVYTIDDSIQPGQIVFVRTGTHAELFN